MINNDKAFSKDLYIIDQDCFHEITYRTMPADINGCGWISAYNLRHYLGQNVNYDDVRLEMDEMHYLKVPGPTLMVVMRAYLKKYVPQAKETVGREEALAAAEKSLAGIFRYRERLEPHFVSYIRTDNGKFRFFNVADGLEDCEMPMSKFGEEHLRGGTVIVFTVDPE